MFNGQQWSAINCDSYAHNNSSRLVFGGTNPYFTPGTLLAIPTNSETMDILENKLITPPGKKIFWTLMNYGGYIVDDSAENDGTLCVEGGVMQQFQDFYNQSFITRPGATFYSDLLLAFQNLKIVKNNGENSIGGGGTPLQPLAPPICDASQKNNV